MPKIKITPNNKARLKRVSLTLFFCLWFGLVFSEELRIDFIPPSGSITINHNNITNSRFVSLNLSAQDNLGGTGVFQMQFSDDALNWSFPEAYSPSKAWVLPLNEEGKNEEGKIVYVRFSDWAGNWSLVYSDIIILDTLVPFVPTLNAVTSPTSSNHQTLTGGRSPDTASILITSDGANVGTVKYPDLTTWSCEITNLKVGKNTFSLKAKDEAGNESIPVTATIVLDVTPPQGTMKINNDNPYTNSSTVTLNLSAQDDSGANDLSQMQFSNDNSNWSNPETFSNTKTWSLSSDDATKTVYVKFKDVAGNWSQAYSDTIILDTTPPITTDSGIDGLWYNSAVTITLTTSDAGSGIDKAYYSTDGSNPAIVYSGPFTLSNEGTYTMKYYSKDKAGNSESIKTAVNQVKIDKSSPTGAIKINNEATYTNSASVTLILSAQDNSAGSGLSQMQFSNDNSTWSSPEAYATTKSWSLTSGDGTKTVYAKFKDVAGNLSAPLSDSIILDTRPPSISIASVTSPTNQDVVLSYNVSDNLTPTAQIVVSGDNSPYTNEGSYNVTLTARDLAGNSSAASVIFTIDKTAPVVVITSPTNGTIFEEPQVTLSGTVDGVAFSETRTLAEGENVLTKTATDSAGNRGSASVAVYYYPGELIGPEGGEVTSADGKVRVIIPPGALAEPKRIKISTVNKETLSTALPEGATLLIVAEFKPLGLSFNKPVKIIYTLDQAEIPGTPVQLGFYNSQENKITLTGSTSTVSKDGYTVEFSVNHFSTYGALKNLTSQGAPLGAGIKIPLPDMFTGSFSQAIPITIPPGRKGVQPNIALSYRSSNPNSWVGLGFSLNPGYIVRSTRLGPPTYDDTKDTFYFVTDAGTTELVHLTDNLYQAKIESSFTKFFKESDDSWKVVGKEGSILRFGQTSDSKETSSSGTFSWYLTKAVDTNGNYLDYRYIKDSGKSYLSRIDYTGNEIGISPTNTIEFLLEARDDISSSYISTAKISTAKRLREIQVKLGYDLVWRYALEYTYSPDTNRSLLKSITQYASDNKNLPQQTFSYQQAK